MAVFGQLTIKADKMGGLGVYEKPTPQTPPRKETLILPIKHWDQRDTPEITAALVSGELEKIWEGIMITREQIDEMFPNFGPDGAPRTYSMRSGALGKPVTKAVIRLSSTDGKIFNLERCNAGQEYQETIAIAQGSHEIRIIINIAQKQVEVILIDPERDRARLQKLNQQ